MDFDKEHWCDNCGRLLFKSAVDFVGHIEVRCHGKKCSSMNVKCSPPLPIGEQLCVARKAYSSHRARVKIGFRKMKDAV